MILFYDSQSGKIIGGHRGTLDDTFANQLPPGADSLLYLENDVTANEAVWGNQCEYTIQNGAPAFTPIPDNVKLADAQQAKIAELEQMYVQSVQTFQSSALSSTRTDRTMWTYLSGVTDMILMGNEYSFVTGPDYDNNPVPWYTVEDGKNVPHTAEQFRQVWRDGRAWVQNQDTHKQTLVAQVQTTVAQPGATVDQINAITW